MIYLAAPYTHEDPVVEHWRFLMATVACAELAQRGLVVYSALTSTHPVDLALRTMGYTGSRRLPASFWCDLDEEFMAQCDEMRILTLKGWKESNGVTRERRFFELRGRPISFMEPIPLPDHFAKWKLPPSLT